jgi:hypothetical protein
MSLRLYPALKGLLADKTTTAAELTTRLRLQPRAIPSRPISTATRRAAAWRPSVSRI